MGSIISRGSIHFYLFTLFTLSSYALAISLSLCVRLFPMREVLVLYCAMLCDVLCYVVSFHEEQWVIITFSLFPFSFLLFLFLIIMFHLRDGRLGLGLGSGLGLILILILASPV